MAAALAFSPIPEPLDYPALADEWGELRRRLDLMKPDIARLKVVESLLEPLFSGTKPDAPVTVEGYQYRLDVPPREYRTEINDIAQVRRAMTAPEFLAIARVTLKDLKAAVPEAKYLTLVTTARTGNRTIKAVRKIA